MQSVALWKPLSDWPTFLHIHVLKLSYRIDFVTIFAFNRLTTVGDLDQDGDRPFHAEPSSALRLPLCSRVGG
jgi:hypothetical protein